METTKKANLHKAVYTLNDIIGYSGIAESRLIGLVKLGEVQFVEISMKGNEFDPQRCFFDHANFCRIMAFGGYKLKNDTWSKSNDN